MQAYRKFLTSNNQNDNILQRNSFRQPTSQTMYDTKISKLAWSSTRTV